MSERKDQVEVGPELRLLDRHWKLVTLAAWPLYTLSQRELAKLIDYVGDRKKITRADVEAIVGAVPRQNRWDWFDLVGAGNIGEARRLYSASLPLLNFQAVFRMHMTKEVLRRRGVIPNGLVRWTQYGTRRGSTVRSP